MLIRLLGFTLTLFFISSVPAATIAVTSTDDTVIANDGKVTLREAITAINAGNDLGDTNIAAQSPGTFGTNDTINFSIPGAGVHTIALASNLPNLNKPVFINGYSQPGASPNTNPLSGGINAILQIEIAAAPGGFGLQVLAPGSAIRGLAIHGYQAIIVGASNVVVAGNFIGTDAAGTTELPGALGSFCVQVVSFGSTIPSNVTVGGPNNADRNLIVPPGGSGSYGIGVQLPYLAPGPGSGYVIQGNYIGTDITGTHALSQGNGLSAISNTLVYGNLISGNPGGAVQLIDNDTLEGNLIGTQRDGASPLPNGNFGGIEIHGGNSVIGYGSEAPPNVIAHNTGYGIVIYNAATQGSSNINTRNQIAFNSIYDNGRLGISLNYSPFVLANDVGDVDTWAADKVGNDGQNYPVITSATVSGGHVAVAGTLNSLANRAFALQFFASAACDASGYGQGQSFIGSMQVVTDVSGNASFNPPGFALPAGQAVITATAIDVSTSTTAYGNTSEFSKCFVATGATNPTTTAVVSSLNPSSFGQSVTFTATVTGNAPSGTVQFKDGASNLGAPVALSGTSAALTTSALSVGTHPITAMYSGDGNNATSTSSLLNQVVNAAALAPTATTLVSSLNPATVGQSVTFTGTVSGVQQPGSVTRVAQGAGPQATPAALTGTVAFGDGATALASVALSASGTATFTTSTLAVGTHPITATYSGDAANTGSSGNLSEVIMPLPPTAPSVPAPVFGMWAILLLISLLVAIACVRAKPGRRSSR